MELKEARSRVVVKYRGGVRRVDACSQVLAEEFMKEIQGGEEKPLTISCNNQGAIALAKDNKFQARAKHIDLRYHFICEAVKDGKIQVKYVPTDDNVSDHQASAKAKIRQVRGVVGIEEVRRHQSQA